MPNVTDCVDMFNVTAIFEDGPSVCDFLDKSMFCGLDDDGCWDGTSVCNFFSESMFCGVDDGGCWPKFVCELE